MHEFSDNLGRNWRLALNVASARRVRNETGVNLLEVEQLTKELADPFTLFDVLWHLVSEQAAAAEVSPEQFGESLTGDAVELATMALLEEIIDFFPQRRRMILKKAFAKSLELDKAMTDHATAQVEKLTLGDLSGALPASSG